MVLVPPDRRDFSPSNVTKLSHEKVQMSSVGSQTTNERVTGAYRNVFADILSETWKAEETVDEDKRRNLLPLAERYEQSSGNHTSDVRFSIEEQDILVREFTRKIDEYMSVDLWEDVALLREEIRRLSRCSAVLIHSHRLDGVQAQQ